MSDFDAFSTSQHGAPQPPGFVLDFRAGENIPTGIRRLLREQVERAHWHLSLAVPNPDDAIHEARKCMKRTRSLLRLVRDELGPETFRRENAAYRDAARLLSSIRSSAVMVETLDKLCAHYPEALSGQEVMALRAALVDRHQAKTRTSLEQEALLKQAAAALAAHRERLPELPIHCEDFTYVKRGLRRIYRRGRRAMRRAGNHPSTEIHHEWRKRVKYLRDGIRVLRFLWPQPMQALADELHQLSNILGLEHDLAELQSLLVREFAEADAPTHAVHAFSQRYRLELQTQAQALGARIYAERPQAFVRRLESYWFAPAFPILSSRGERSAA